MSGDVSAIESSARGAWILSRDDYLLRRPGLAGWPWNWMVARVVAIGFFPAGDVSFERFCREVRWVPCVGVGVSSSALARSRVGDGLEYIIPLVQTYLQNSYSV